MLIVVVHLHNTSTAPGTDWRYITTEHSASAAGGLQEKCLARNREHICPIAVHTRRNNTRKAYEEKLNKKSVQGECISNELIKLKKQCGAFSYMNILQRLCLEVNQGLNCSKNSWNVTMVWPRSALSPISLSSFSTDRVGSRTIQPFVGNILLCELGNVHVCVQYRRIRRLWVGCHEWWGSRPETRPPAQQRRSPGSRKACERRGIQPLSAGKTALTLLTLSGFGHKSPPLIFCSILFPN